MHPSYYSFFYNPKASRGESSIAFSSAVKTRCCQGGLVFLYGECGTGKTGLSSDIVQLFTQSVVATSPTFGIVNSYAVNGGSDERWGDQGGSDERWGDQGGSDEGGSDEGVSFSAIHHLDLYRIKSLEEVRQLAILEMLADSLVIIEWPELAEELFIPLEIYPDIKLEIKYTSSENLREVNIFMLE